MTLTDVLDKELIKVPLESDTKYAVLEELVDTLIKRGNTLTVMNF